MEEFNTACESMDKFVAKIPSTNASTILLLISKV